MTAGELTVTTWDTHGAGRLAHTRSPDGVEQDFTYTALGQLDTLTYTVDGEDFEFTLAYDGIGRSCIAANARGLSDRASTSRAVSTSSGLLSLITSISSGARPAGSILVSAR